MTLTAALLASGQSASPAPPQAASAQASPAAALLDAITVITQTLEEPQPPVSAPALSHLPSLAVASYRIQVNAGHAVAITFQQRTGEIAAVLRAKDHPPADGPPVRRSEAGRLARISFTLPAASDSVEEIRVRCITKTNACEYTVRMSGLAVSPDTAIRRAGFEDALAQADALRRKPDTESKTASVSAYDHVLDLAHALNDPSAVSQALYGRGRVQLELRRYADARDSLKLASALQLSKEDSPLTATAWKALGYSYAYLADLQDAISSYSEAAKLYQLNDDLLNQEILINNMARAHRVLGENHQALTELHTALNLARSLNDHRGISSSLEELGNIQLSLGDLQDALDAYRDALASLTDAPNPAIQAHVLNGLGNVYVLFEEPEAAKTSFDQSLALWRELKDPMGAAYALDGMGFLASVEHDPALAIQRYQDALASVHGLGLDRETATILEESGEAYEAAGDHAKAREQFHQSLDLATKLHLRAVEADCLRGLGESAATTGDAMAALDFYTRAEHAYTGVGDTLKQAVLLADRARLDRSQHHLEEALREIEAAISLIEASRRSIRNPDNRSNYFSGQRDYYDFEISLLMEMGSNHAARALEFSERARSRALVDALRESGIEPLTARTGDSESTTEAAGYALLKQEQSLGDRIETQTDRLSQLEQDSPAKGARPEDSPDSIRQAIQAMQQERAALEIRIGAQFPAYAALMQPETISASSIQSGLLDKETLLLEYWLGRDHSYVWAVTSSHIAVYELPAADAINLAARKLNEDWTARNDSVPGETLMVRDQRIRHADLRALRESQALSNILLGPIARALTDYSRIIISAEGSLLALPFAALPSPSSAKPLVADHEIVNLPSASILAQLRRVTETAQTARFALFADPVFSAADPRVASRDLNRRDEGSASVVIPASRSPHGGSAILTLVSSTNQNAGQPNLQRTAPEVSGITESEESARSLQEPSLHHLSRLPYSRLEAESIRRLLPSGSLWESLDFDANRDVVRSANWQGYAVIHFSTHAVLNPLHPELSGIVLSLVDRDGRARDGLLRVQDIYGMHMPADLVVLSACQTARGKDVPGEGVIGLSRAFFYAGSRRVLATLWDVNDRGTATLMSSFYDGMIHRGLSPAAALAASQRKMARTTEWSAPYFWAPFTLNGEWRQTSRLETGPR